MNDVERSVKIAKNENSEKCQGMNYEFMVRGRLVAMNDAMHRQIRAIMPKRYRFVIQLACVEKDNQGLSVFELFKLALRNICISSGENCKI